MVIVETVINSQKILEKQSQLMFVIVISGPWCTLLGSYRMAEDTMLIPLTHWVADSTDSTCHPMLTFLRQEKATTDALWELGAAEEHLRPLKWIHTCSESEIQPSLLLRSGGLCTLHKVVCAMVLGDMEI